MHSARLIRTDRIRMLGDLRQRIRDSLTGTRAWLCWVGRQCARSRRLAAAAGLPTGIRTSADPPLRRLVGVQGSDATAVYELPWARIRGLSGHFEAAVFDDRDRLIPELSPDVGSAERHRVYSEPRWGRPAIRRGTAVCLVTPGARNNYYHWLLELLPKIHLAEQAGVGLHELPWILLGHSGAAYQLETLAMLGVDAARVVNVSSGTNERVERLIMPTHPSARDRIEPWAVGFVRERLLPLAAAGVGPEKIYIDRGTAGRRPLLNNAEVRSRLEAAGFLSVDPGTLPVREQIALFRDARVIVGAHGAAFANIAFCRPGARLVELLPPAYQPAYFRNLADVAGVEWQAAVGSVASDARPMHPRRAIELPFVFPCERLAGLLECAG